MKKTLIGIVCLYSTSSLNAQISKTSVAKQEIEVVTGTYDSTSNFLGENAMLYKGQELYLLEKSQPLRKYGYEGFIKNPLKNKYNKGNIVNCCDGGNSKYKDLAGKYFIVTDVIPAIKLEKPDILNKSIYYLKLEEKETKNSFYYIYDSNYMRSFPFVTMGYFNKLKQNQIGKEYILRGRNWINSEDKIFDLITGKEIADYSGKVKWQVVDVSIEEKYYSLSLILKNAENETISFDVYYLDRDNYYWAIPLSEMDQLKEKIGEEYWEYVLDNRVKLGMGKDAALLSWGNPKKINKTISDGFVTEQWVYSSGNYLYFKNGILSTIQ